MLFKLLCSHMYSCCILTYSSIFLYQFTVLYLLNYDFLLAIILCLSLLNENWSNGAFTPSVIDATKKRPQLVACTFAPRSASKANWSCNFMQYAIFTCVKWKCGRKQCQTQQWFLIRRIKKTQKTFACTHAAPTSCQCILGMAQAP